MKKLMKKINIIDNVFRDPLLKNSIYLMITSFMTSVIGFFFWIIAARFYTPSDIGTVSAILSSMSLISMIGSLGLHIAMIFYLPRDKNTDKIISSCLVTGIISSTILSSTFILGLKVWTPELLSTLNNLENILIFIVVTIAISISGFIGAALIAGRKSSFQMIKEIIYQIVKIFPLISFTGLGAIGIVLSFGIGLAISIFVGFILLFKIWKYIPRFTLDPIIKKMANFSVMNYVADIFYNFPRLILPIMILNTVSSRSAGYFYIALMVASLLYGVSQSISSCLLVESSDIDTFSNNINKAIIFNLIILIPGILLIIFGNFVLNIFNPSYVENATITMIILSMTSIPLSMINIFNVVRNAQNRVMSIVKINFIVAIITIILSMYFIKTMSIEGAAISYLLANVIGSIIVIYIIKDHIKIMIKLLKKRGDKTL